MKLEINLTEAEAKALAHVVVDPLEWASNAIRERCRLAMQDIFRAEVQRMVADPSVTVIPADMEEVVLNADIVPLADIHVASLEERQ